VLYQSSPDHKAFKISTDLGSSAESDYGVELWFQAPEQLVAKPNHSKFQYPWFWSIVTPKKRGKVIQQEFTIFYLFGGCHTLKSPGDPAAAAAAALLFLSVL